jgi:hypothetical protein
MQFVYQPSFFSINKAGGKKYLLTKDKLFPIRVEEQKLDHLDQGKS